LSTIREEGTIEALDNSRNVLARNSNPIISTIPSLSRRHEKGGIPFRVIRDLAIIMIEIIARISQGSKFPREKERDRDRDRDR
jgi:hypothetical protein